jgi:hypothetical protein
LRGVDEVCLQPQRGSPHADLRKVRTLPAIANEGWLLLMHFREAYYGTPHRDIGRVGSNVLRVAIDASF